MSELAITGALEAELVGMTPGFETASENKKYDPVDNVPYQQVDFLFASPQSFGFEDQHTRETGYMQVRLKYPREGGAGPALARAVAIKAHFRRGLPLTLNGVTTVIDRAPHIGQGSYDGDRYVIPVRITFYANILK